MVQAIKSELLKIKTLRSTYFTFGAALALTALYAFFVNGKDMPTYGLPPDGVYVPHPEAFAVGAIMSLSFLSIIILIYSALSITNEYRFNTITNTLLSANRRYKIFVSKLASLSLLSLLVTTLVYFVALLGVYLGVKVGHVPHDPQSVSKIFDGLLRVLIINQVYVLLGVGIAFLTRNIAVTVVSCVVAPNIFEAILGVIFRPKPENDLYFSPISNLYSLTDLSITTNTLVKLIVVSFSYFGLLALISLWLFKKRDATSS